MCRIGHRRAHALEPTPREPHIKYTLLINLSWVLRERCERGRAAGRAAAPRGGRRENILPFVFVSGL